MLKYLILFGLLLAACGGTQTAVPAKPATIICTAAYRTSITQPIEKEAQISFTDNDGEQAIPFSNMIFHAVYTSGSLDNERTLRLWVTDTEGTATYQSHLYQFDPVSGPLNQFQGGHGFTGLNYSYHPESQAETQFWCAAK